MNREKFEKVFGVSILLLFIIPLIVILCCIFSMHLDSHNSMKIKLDNGDTFYISAEATHFFNGESVIRLKYAKSNLEYRFDKPILYFIDFDEQVIKILTTERSNQYRNLKIISRYTNCLIKRLLPFGIRLNPCFPLKII